MCVCHVCVYINSTCDNILSFLLVEIFMLSPHLSMQFKQTGSGVLSPFSKRSQPPGGPSQTRRSIVRVAWPSPLPCPNICVYIKTWYPFSITHSFSSKVFIFGEQGTVSRELWYVNSCDPSQVSHRPQRGCTVWWCLKRRKWKGINEFGSSLCSQYLWTHISTTTETLHESRIVTLLRLCGVNISSRLTPDWLS